VPILNIILPMHGMPPVTADQLFTRGSSATGQPSDADVRLDCLAHAVREQWRVIANPRADGTLEEVELVKWFAELQEATEALDRLAPPSDRRFYLRTTDGESPNVITNVTGRPADFLHDPDSPAGEARRS
jgi:hypothetical protein